MDVAGIEPGRDFRKAIDQSVATCDLVLPIIGPEWLEWKDAQGHRRLDDANDFVRIELASALRRDIPVVPVLVRGAKMPRVEQLPDDLKDLAYRNCIELTHARWRSDIHLLVEALRRMRGDASQIAIAHTQQATDSPPQASSSKEATVPPSPRDEPSTSIDPALIQRVSRELALHIGPIADIVVRRAAPRSNSVEDLYLKVAEEIDSSPERAKFLARIRN